jgi:predicted nucleic acid-binding protein
MRFLDTNVLLYLVSTAPEEAGKAEVAAAVLESGDLALSVQVLLEFYAQATRTRPSGRASLAHEQAVALIEAFQRFPVQETTTELLQAALATKKRHQISIWDATIVEAARISGCDVILSEDLSHGQSYGGVRVVNPFRRAARS